MSRWLGPVCCSLASAGYRTRALQISAADVGAPHRRERVFVVAYTNGLRRMEQEGRQCDERGRAQDGGPMANANRDAIRISERRGSGACGTGASEFTERGEAGADSTSERRHERSWREREARRGPFAEQHGPMGDAHSQRPQERQGERKDASEDCSSSSGAGHRRRRHRQVEPGLGRSATRLPHGLNAHRWPASRGEEQYAWEPTRTVEGRDPQRRARLTALGNAFVPHQAREAVRWVLAMGVLP